MALAERYMSQQQMGRGGPSGLADVLEVLLDKGLVIDAFVRVSLVGIELLTIDARIVIASVDTYLRFAEAVNRLDLLQVNNAQTLGDLVGDDRSNDRGSDRRDRDEDAGQRDESSDGESRALGSSTTGSETEPMREREPEPAARARDDDDKSLIDKVRDRGKVF